MFDLFTRLSYNSHLLYGQMSDTNAMCNASTSERERRMDCVHCIEAVVDAKYYFSFYHLHLCVRESGQRTEKMNKSASVSGQSRRATISTKANQHK